MLGRLKNRIGRSLSQESGGNSDGSTNNRVRLAAPVGVQERALDYNAKLTDLQSFDVCVETSDAMAAASSSTSAVEDCSVRVSPDGDLLLVAAAVNGTTATTTALEEDECSKSRDAVYMGNDLVPAKKLNGFSAMGWSAAATSLAIRQTQYTLSDTETFLSSLRNVEQLHQRAVAQACLELRSNVGIGSLGQPSSPPSSKLRGRLKHKKLDLKSLSELEPMGSSWQRRSNNVLELCPHRVGPLAYSGSSLYAALTAVEQYYTSASSGGATTPKAAAAADSETPPVPTPPATTPSSIVQELHGSAGATSERLHHREKALKEMQKKVNETEKSLATAKTQALKKWNMVHHAEETVTKIMEERMLERSRARERARLSQLQQEQAEMEKNQVPFATNAEIWDIVAAATASMEDGDFTPLDLPTGARMSGVVDQSTPQKGNAPTTDAATNTTASGQATTESNTTTASSSEPSMPNVKNLDLTSPGTPPPEPIPMASRSDVEQECRLPELRAAAMAADEAIRDWAQELLLVLAKLDTTRRSARVAAETCLLSASHAQQAALKQWVKLEKASLTERLKQLEQLEHVVDQVDVRSDLGLYITVDKKERGGSTWMGDDDDGGIASALAVLSSHVEGSMGIPSSPSKNSSSMWAEEMEEDETTTPEALEDAVQELFDESTPPPTETVDRLCRVASDHAAAKSKRSTMCYALNAKRTSAECHSQAHFDALVRVFSAILTGCDFEPGGVANAKMCMMLSQTFYIVDSNDDNDNGNDDRNKRNFVKSKLIGHDLWQQDEFWDQALHQCVSESLTHSGVMANFDRAASRKSQMDLMNQKNAKANSEWTQTRKCEWHDLGYAERSEAASQVHAVVFAQLGALAHSMMEFQCGMERSCSFVRRMAVRNQLPISQRTMLLQHLMGSSKSSNTSSSGSNAGDGNEEESGGS